MTAVPSKPSNAVRHAARARSWRRRGTDGNDVEALDARDAVGGILLLKPIHFVPVQLCRPPRSQQTPHELTGRLLGSDLEDRRGKHVEALDGSSRNDSSAKAIGGVVGGRPCSIRRAYGDPSPSPAWCGQTAVGSNVVRTQVSWCRWCTQRCEICNCCRW
jgi:hypothetical protein